MRYTPFGSGSYETADSSSLAQFSVTASYALQTDSASYAVTSSKGPPGDACSSVGPYDSYPPTYV